MLRDTHGTRPAEARIGLLVHPETQCQRKGDGFQTVPARATDTPPQQSPRQVQRRLLAADVDDICASYVRGNSIDELARSYTVNRTTIIKHLDQRSVPRRRVVRKMSDVLVAEAAAMYLHGDSLRTVADAFKIDARTLGREFRKAGVAIRPRWGWTY